jgi:alkylation response protein AidB-like acyl-CoA dehydrogenase
VTLLRDAIYQAELVEAGAPPIWGRAGVYLLAPTLEAHASLDQRNRYVHSVLSGDLVFCQAFSEPDAGSDLASLRARAVRDTDGWRLSGQKCWSSGAMFADRAFVLARTDQGAPPHQGIGFFLLDLRQPGVQVRPTQQATGNSEFGEIFLDGAFVNDCDVVGDYRNGWRIAMTTFSFERVAIANAMLIERSVDELIRTARDRNRTGDPRVRQQVAQALIKSRVFKWLSLRDLTRYEHGIEPRFESSLSKIGWSETAKMVRSVALDLCGPEALIESPGDDGTAPPWDQLWLWSVAQTIYGGTSEIQRNIVAERMLGLPPWQ